MKKLTKEHLIEIKDMRNISDDIIVLKMPRLSLLRLEYYFIFEKRILELRADMFLDLNKSISNKIELWKK